MSDGKILFRKILTIKSPLSELPRYFGYIHTKADSPDYYSKGILRSGENHCIFHYTLHGRGSCYNEFGRFETKPGQGFLSIIHDPLSGYAYPDDGTEEWEFICFCFDGGNSIALFRELIREYGPIYTVDKNSDVIAELKSVAYSEDSYPQTPFESSRLFYSLYSELVRSAITENKAQAEKGFHPYVRSTQNIVRTEIEQNPSIDQIAMRLGLSREYLSRLFKAETGKMLKDYIREERILRICKLLKRTEMSIKDIGETMSFSSSTNFVRFFHNIMHITPTDFRRHGSMPDFLTLASNSRKNP